MREVCALAEGKGTEEWSSGEQGAQIVDEELGGGQAVKHRLGCDVAVEACEVGQQEQEVKAERRHEFHHRGTDGRRDREGRHHDVRRNWH